MSIHVIINIKLEINELIFLRITADNVICSGHLHENKLHMLSGPNGQGTGNLVITYISYSIGIGNPPKREKNSLEPLYDPMQRAHYFFIGTRL